MAIQSKQISKLLTASIRINGFAVTGASSTITSAITTVLSSAGDGGVSVPLQVATATSIGVVTSGTANRVEIYDATTKDKIKSAGGDEVYARLTETSGVYTLTYYSLASGTETPYTFTSATIDFEFNYKYDFYRLPSDAIVSIGSRNIVQDPRAIGNVYTEKLNVTAQNTISALTKTPNVTYNLRLVVNAATYTTLGGGSAPLSVNGKALTWSVVNSGFNIDTTDEVIAIYTTNE